MTATIKHTAVARFGLGPVLHRKQQLSTLRSQITMRRHEHRESTLGGVVAEAFIVTIIPTIGRTELSEAAESAVGQDVEGHRVVVVTDGVHALPPLPRSVTVLRTTRQVWCGRRRAEHRYQLHPLAARSLPG